MARGIVYSTERLRTLFEPRSIALVGASEKSTWSLMIHVGLSQGGFSGQVYYVNPRNPSVHGQPTVARLVDIPEPVDLCYIMVGTEMVLPVIHDMIEAKIHNAVVLTGGFAEQDEHGRELQAEITRLAAEHDLALIGPNCMGFINITRQTEAMATLPSRPLLSGHVALISQSGALGGQMLNYAHSQNVGLSMLVSTGNEATISITDALQYAVEDEASKVLAVFMETIREPERFAQIARRAFDVGKPIIALKAGSSEATARVALTHTGALTGDDRVIDALFRQLGIVRVSSIEELVLTANLFARVGHLPGKRLGIVAISGGACDLSADLAEASDLELPIFDESTKTDLRELLPVIGPANNPLDTTGAAMNNQALMGQLLAVVTRDPQLDAVFCVMDPIASDSPQAAFLKAILTGIGQALTSSPVPAFMLPLSSSDITSASRKFLTETGLPFVSGGIRHVLPALGRLAAWSERYRASQAQPATPAAAVEPLAFAESPSGNWSEYQASAFLAQQGVPTIPARLVNSVDQAVTAAREMGLPVVLKIASPDILHKSDIGGVALDIQSEGEVRVAFERLIQAAGALSPVPRIEGVLVSPMRAGGVELLVGISRDPDWGQVLAVGLGGVWVEILKDTSLRVLPVTRADIHVMLNELQGAKLLRGARGSLPADLPALVETIYAIAEVAQRLQTDLESLEINPLRVHGSQIEALDAVISWRAGQPAQHHETDL